MDIFYKCKCMREEATVAVPDRRDDEDIGDWMGKVALAIAADHQLRSTLCAVTSMEYAKIPLPENTPFIGGKPKLDG